MGKESTCNKRDRGSTSGLGRSPKRGQGNPLQYSCLENPMDRGVGRATAHGVAKSQTRLSDWATEHTHINTARLSSPSYGWGIWTTKSRWLTPGCAAGEGSQDLNPGWASWAWTTEPLCFLQKQWWLVRVRPIPGHGSKKLRNTD